MHNFLSTGEWKRFLGIETYKLDWYLKYYLYKLFRITLPKLENQKDYWQSRGMVYMDEIMSSNYLDREVFFQNMLVDYLKQIEFDSFFEAGCGFGWNIKRVKDEFPAARVGGVDFSVSQLSNAAKYVQPHEMSLVQSDICNIQLEDNFYDVGFSLGVFMNIHPDKIKQAASEMIRVCGKYIIHIEYDENNTTKELRHKRAFKTNIVSHDYKKIYEELGKEVVEFKTYKDFADDYYEHVEKVSSNLDRWEGFEGPEKYIFIVVKL